MGVLALIEINDLYFSYPQSDRYTLSGIRLSVREGEFVVLCGPSGCGKTTLLRHLKPELRPRGTRRGTTTYRGRPMEDAETSGSAARIGYVQQDPEHQIVMDRVLQELAFGMENVGVPPAAMRKRLAEMASFFGIEDWLHRKTAELSGGEKQLVNLASALLMRPDVLLLDEPTAQLDPVASKQLLQLVRRCHEEFGLTIVMTEHRLEELFPMADRIVMMGPDGAVRYEGAPREVAKRVHEREDAAYLAYVPSVARLFLTAAPTETVPLTVGEGRAALGRLVRERRIADGDGERTESPRTNRSPVIACRELTFAYERHAAAAIDHLDFALYSGDLFAIVGGNGAGKSTLLRLLAGLLAPRRGSVKLLGKPLEKWSDGERYRAIGYLPQHPLSYFLYDTVEQELLEAAIRGAPGKPPSEQARRMAERFGLEPILSMHPHDLSGGERQKVVLACVLMSNPKLILLDEPTKGLDPHTKDDWGRLLRTLAGQGTAIAFVTHDIEFAAAYANRCAMLFDGAIATEGTPAQLFGENYFYTTAVNKLVRGYVPNALTEKEVLRRWSAPVSY